MSSIFSEIKEIYKPVLEARIFPRRNITALKIERENNGKKSQNVHYRRQMMGAKCRDFS